MELPGALSHGLKVLGFKQIQNGIWKHGKDRWSLFCVEAPQSWERMLSPLMAEAVLESRAHGGLDAHPLPALYAPRLSDAMHQRLAVFMERVAPSQPWLVCDAQGRLFLHIRDYPEGDQGKPLASRPAPLPRRNVSLFSDLHQWMMKVLLAPRLREDWLQAPRGRPVRNASVLAEVCGVSIPAAARFVQALDKAGHLQRRSGELKIADPLRLLEEWRVEVPVSFRQELGARFVRGPLDDAAFHGLLKVVDLGGWDPGLKAAMGLFSACDALKLGHVRGGPRHLYLSALRPEALEALGIILVEAGEKADLVLRVPRYPEALFRASVKGATDVIQCWLDVSQHRARGQEQADFLWRKALRPSLETA